MPGKHYNKINSINYGPLNKKDLNLASQKVKDWEAAKKTGNELTSYPSLTCNQDTSSIFHQHLGHVEV